MRLSLQAKRVVAAISGALMIVSSVPTQALAGYADATNQLTGAAAAATVQSAVGQLPQQDDAASAATQVDKSQGAAEAPEPAATTPGATAPAGAPTPEAHTLAWALAEAGATADAAPLAQGTWDLELGENRLAEGVTLQCGRAVAEVGGFFVLQLRVDDATFPGHASGYELRLNWDNQTAYVAREGAFVTLGEHSKATGNLAFDKNVLTAGWTDPQAQDAQELYLELYLGDYVSEGRATDEARRAEREEIDRQNAERAEQERIAREQQEAQERQAAEQAEADRQAAEQVGVDGAVAKDIQETPNNASAVAGQPAQEEAPAAAPEPVARPDLQQTLLSQCGLFSGAARPTLAASLVPMAQYTFYQYWNYTKAGALSGTGQICVSGTFEKSFAMDSTYERFYASASNFAVSGYAISKAVMGSTDFTSGQTSYYGNSWQNQTTAKSNAYNLDITITYQNQCTVTYKANGGSGSDQSATYKTGVSGQKFKGAIFARTGYTLSGWDTNNKATSPTYSTNQSVADDWINSNKPSKTFYAIWSANTYTVTLDGNGATTAGTASVTATYDAAMPSASMPTRTGYTFAGYYDATSGGNQYYTADGSSARTWNKASATTLYARWTANQYTVTLDGNGATTEGAASVTATYDAAMPSAAMPSRTGYQFDGYCDTDAAAGGTQYYTAAGASARTWNKAEDFTLYARWAANPYKVAYNGNGNTGGSTSTTNCTYDTTSKVASCGFTKTNYHFVGWNTAANGSGDSYAAGDDILNWTDVKDKTITLYAQWELNEYDVTFDDQGGAGGQGSKTIMPTDTVSSLGAVPIPVRANYTFDGYFTEAGGNGTRVINTDGTWASKPSAACTVYAKWDYTVSYQANDAAGSTRATGSVADTSHVYAKGTSLSAGAGISRVGYNVDGWATEAGGARVYTLSQSVTDVADPKTLYAHWASVTYKVVYEANAPTGASTTPTGSTPAATHTFDASKNIDACGYGLTGYTFKGWNTQADGTGTSYAPDTPVTNLIADPSHDGTSEFKLYAQWEANTYTVTLASPGTEEAPGNPATQTVEATFDQPMPEMTRPVREGYGFAGFFAGEGGTGTQYYGEGGESTHAWDVADNATLYANWGPRSYLVVFDANKPAGAQADNPVKGTTDTMRLYVDETKSLSENGYSLAGYTFLGWATDPAATTPDFQDEAEVKDLVQNPSSDGNSSITLHAIWQANSYAVTYAANGGTLGGQEPAAVTCDATVAIAGDGSNPTPPAGADWAFAGWQVTRTGESTDGEVGAVYQDESGAWLYRGGSCDVTLTARWLVSVPTPVSGLSYVKDGTGAGVAQTLVAAGQGYVLLSPAPKDASDAADSGLSDGSAFATHAGEYDVTASLDAADFTDMGAVRWAGESGAWDGADANDRTLSCAIDKATNSWVVEPAISSVVYGTDLTPVATADFQAATDEPVIQYALAQKAGEGYAPSGDFSTDVPSEAGDYLMRATVAEADDYYGITSDGDHFEIARYEIPHPGSDAEQPTWAASVEAPDAVYAGEALLPASVTVTLPEPLSVRGRTELVRDTEYVVSYWFDEGLTQSATDAEGNSLMVDAGTYYVRVDGVSNFQGWSVGTFVVKPASTMTMGDPTSFVGTYDGQSHTVTPAEVEGVLARDTDNTQIMWSTSPDDESSWTADPITFRDTTYSVDGVDAPHVVYLRVQNPNYVTTPSVSGTVSIGRKAVTVTPQDVSKEYGTPDPELPCEVDGLVEGDAIDYTPVREAGKELGEYEISVDGSGAQGSYFIDYGTATFTIVARDIASARIDGLAERYAFSGSAVEPAVDVVFADGTRLVAGQDFQATYASSDRIGTATVSVEGVGNYVGTLSADYTIFDDKPKPLPVYRLYNPNSGEHFYTLSANERTALVGVGWTDEGVGWYAPDHAGDQVFRVYNPFTGDHHYTASGFERDYLVNAGWRDEGVAWLSDAERRVPLYRDYNPNARVGSHNYTTSANEHRVLGTMGWRAEGVGWYGMPKQ